MSDAAPEFPPARQMLRLHKALYVVELIQLLVPAACFSTAFLLVRLVGGRAWSMIAVITFYCCYALFAATRRYRATGIQLRGDQLLIRTGPHLADIRALPVHELLLVETRATLLHRLLGMVELRIVGRTAAPGDALFSFLPRRQAEQLCTKLRALNPALDLQLPQDETRAGRLIWAATTRELVLHGLTENRAGVILGVVYLIGQAVRGQTSTPQRPLELLLASWMGWTTATITVKMIIAVVALFLAGFLFSTALTLAEFHPYRLYRAGRELRRRYGNLTGHESVLHEEEIQALRLEAVPIRQWTGFWNIEAVTAGNPLTGRPGRSNPLLLLTRTHELPEHCRWLIPGLPWPVEEWRSADALCTRRFLVANAPLGILACLLAGWWFTPWLYLGAVTWLLLIALIAWIRRRVLGYAEMPDHLVTQAGVWTRNRYILPYRHVQYVEMIVSRAQRRLGLATLHVGFPGSGKYSLARIPDIPVAAATALRDRLLARAAH